MNKCLISIFWFFLFIHITLFADGYAFTFNGGYSPDKDEFNIGFSGGAFNSNIYYGGGFSLYVAGPPEEADYSGEYYDYPCPHSDYTIIGTAGTTLAFELIGNIGYITDKLYLIGGLGGEFRSEMLSTISESNVTGWKYEEESWEEGYTRPTFSAEIGIKLFELTWLNIGYSPGRFVYIGWSLILNM